MSGPIGMGVECAAEGMSGANQSVDKMGQHKGLSYNNADDVCGVAIMLVD
jgi:hypothetical protein